MRFPRSSGILLHPTSLPGPWGIGDLGPAAYAFVDFLAAAGQSLWQILPLGPTGYGDSPYQCFSAFAGNPLLISLDALIQRGLLSYDEAASAAAERHLSLDAVQYGEVLDVKLPLLQRAFERLRRARPPIWPRICAPSRLSRPAGSPIMPCLWPSRRPMPVAPGIPGRPAARPPTRGAGARPRGARRGDRLPGVPPVPLFPSVASPEGLRQPAGHRHHRRCADLRGL